MLITPTDQVPWETIQTTVSDEEVTDALVGLFNHNQGRVANHEQLLLWFPDLLKPYWELVNALMHGQGFLP
jgi:sestrin